MQVFIRRDDFPWPVILACFIHLLSGQAEQKEIIVTDFFQKQGVAPMSLRDLFNFIVDNSLAEEDVDDRLEELNSAAIERHSRGLTPDELADEQVFRESYIPRSLDEVSIVLSLCISINRQRY